MKRLLLLISVLSFVHLSYGQQITNGNFSNWVSQTLFEIPEYWFTSGMDMDTVAQKVSDAQHLDYAVRLNTVAIQGDTMFGALVYGNPEADGLMGMPYSELGDMFHFWYKSNIQVGDMGFMLITLTKNGVQLDSLFYPFTALNNQNNWTLVSLPINPTQVAPDSMFIGFVSSAPDDWGGTPVPGSWLMIDNVFFTLGANPIPIPVPNYSFEDWISVTVEDPEAWSSSNSHYVLIENDTANVYKTSDAHSAPFAAKFQVVDINGSKPTARLIYEDDNLNLIPDALSFYYKYIPNGNADAFVMIDFYSSGNNIGGTWFPINTPASTYTHALIDNINILGSETPDRIKIEFNLQGDEGSLFFLDDVKFNCIKPRNFYAFFSSSSQINAVWDIGGFENQWQIEWGMHGFVPGTGTLVTVNTNTSETFTGVSDVNNYDFYIRSICAPGDESAWVGPFTVCKAQNISIFENFESYNYGDFPVCWFKNSSWDISVSDYGGYNSSKCLRIQLEGMTNSYIASPRLDEDISDLYISFYAKKTWPANTSVVIGTMSNPNNISTFDTLGIYPLINNYKKISHYFNNYLGTDKHIAIMLIADFGQNAEVFIDDILIDGLPDCLPPMGLQVSNITTSGAEVSWTAGAPNLWDIVYGPFGIDPYTQGPQINGVNTATHMLSPLTSGTSYEVFVRSDCGVDGLSDFASEIFTTNCTSYNVPIAENFDAPMLNDIPNCWSKIVQGNWGEVYVVPWSGYSHPAAMNMRVGDTQTEAYIITPDIFNPIEDLFISFYAYEHSPGNAILTLGTISHDSVFTAVQNFTLTNNYNQFNYSFDTYTGSHTRIAFRLTSTADIYTEIFIDDIHIDVPPTCFVPQNVNIMPSATEAHVTWQPGASETQWNIILAYEWEPNWQANFVERIDGVNNQFYTFTNLNTNNAYSIYIQSDCGGGDLSSWAGPFNFHTPCDNIFAYYEYNFDDINTWDMPMCWHSIRYHTNWEPYVGINDLNAYSNPNHIYIYNGTQPDPNGQLMMVTPMLDNVADKQIRFMAKSPQAGTPLVIGHMISQHDPNDFNPITTINLTNTYTEYIVPLNLLSGNTYLAFSHGSPSSGNDTEIFIDDFIYEVIPTCPKPVNLMVSNITLDEAKLHWSAGGSETTWHVEVRDFVTDLTVDSETVIDTFWTATGLNFGTYYNFYVQAECDPTDMSVWAGPFMFKTACPIETAPFTETFEGAIFPPMCWDTISGSGNWQHTNTAGGYGNSSSSALANFYNIQHNTPFDLITLTFDASGITNPYLMFDYAYAYKDMQNYDYLNILYSTDGGNTYNILESMHGINDLSTAGQLGFSFVPAASQWATKDIALPLGTNNILFRAISGWGNNLYIDNITVDEAPSCLPPTNFQIANITTNSANITWDGTADSYEIEYGQAPYTFSGTAHITGIMNEFYNFMALNHSTTYVYRVRALCGAQYSNWSSTHSFTTVCDEYSYIYENFDNVTVPNLPNCWSLINIGNPVAYVGTHAYMFYSYPYSLLLYNDTNETTGADLMAITPQIADMTTKQVRFHAVTLSPSADIIVGTMSDPTMPSTFNQIAVININPFFEEYYVSLANAVSTDSYFAFRHANPNIGNEEAIFIDNFILEDLESCPRPTQLTAIPVTTNSMQLAWVENGTATQWQIVWAQQGNIWSSGDTILATNTYHVLENLIPGNHYEFMVRSVCDPVAGDTSMWSNLYHFTTEYVCADNAIYGQTPKPIEYFIWSTSELNQEIFQSFENINSEFDRINVWGVQAFHTGSGADPCSQSPMDIEVRFYQDNNGHIGTQTASFIVPVVPDTTGAIVSSVFEILSFEIQFPMVINQTNGWFSLRSVNSPTCFSLFANTTSWEAEGTLLRVQNSTDTSYHSPLAYCFINNSSVVEYLEGANGTLVGQTLQHLAYGAATTSVEAVPATCYEFVEWSDGRTDNPRIDSNVVDDIIVTALFGLRIIEHYETASICQGDTFFFGDLLNQILTIAGPYTGEFVTLEGCDSTIYLTLEVNPSYVMTTYDTICDNAGGYLWRDSLYNVSGTYYDSLLTDTYMCDSIYVLHLVVYPTYEYVVYDTICDNAGGYLWRDLLYNVSGTYYDSLLTDAYMCDSIYVLHLVVYPTYEYVVYDTICDIAGGYLWRDSLYNVSGTYYDSLLTGTYMCDSIYVLHLIVYPTYEYVVYDTICDGDTYSWHGNDYMTAGTYYDSLSTINGCDSVYVLQLFVHDLPTVSISGLNNLYCEYHAAATITGTPAGGTFSGQGVTGNQFIPTDAGIGIWTIYYTYEDDNMCINTDSVIVEVDECAGIEEFNIPQVRLYPNPNDGNFVMELYEKTTVSIFNAIGKLIYQKEFYDGLHPFSFNHLANGVYFIKAEGLTTSENIKIVVQK